MRKLRYIVSFVLLLTTQWVLAATQLVSHNKDWLGNNADIKTTIGNDFWLTFMTNNAAEADNPSLRFVIYAVSDTAAHIIVEANGNQLGVIDIPEGGGMGFLENITPAAVYVQANESETRVPKGIHVFTQDKGIFFSCYSLAEAGSGPGSTRDASLILPTRILGKEYYVQTYPTDTRSTEFAIIATEDNTNITITPAAQTSKQSQADQPITLNNMSKGQVYLIRSDEPNRAPKIDMSGSKICSNNPIAVFHGNEAAKIANGNTGAFSPNHMFEQTLPIAQWGKEFYIGITAHATWNFYNVTAAYDGTNVYIDNATSPIQLNAGESFASPKYLVNMTGIVKPDAKITADKPVLLNAYLSCGGANSETSWDSSGELATYSWGNSTMTMMPAWEMRVKRMALIADSITNESDAGVRHIYVQVITKTTDKSLFTLSYPNGTQQSVDASLFSAITADGSMSVANIELPDFGKYTIETTGEGFVGFVYNITSQARAYQYTLGFSPVIQPDSLYITNPEALMSRSSYDLDPLDGHGWYQRQWKEWAEGKERLDTAIICDSSTVFWSAETPFVKPVDNIEWSIYDVTDKAKPSPSTMLEGFPITITPSATDIKHNINHRFILPEELENNRKPFFEYEMQMIMIRNRLFCPDEDPDRDTLRSVVRVLRQYNDTIWKAICMGDTVHFFKDTVWKVNPASISGKPVKNRDYILQETVFNDTTDNLEKGLYQYSLGALTVTRQYISSGGCDSLSTLKLFVCATDSVHIDTVVCQDGTKNLDFGDFFLNYKRNNSWPKGENTLKDVLFATSCMQDPDWEEFAPHCPNFKGCDSILELHLTVMEVKRHPTTVNQCLSIGDTYEWREEGSDRLIATFTVGSESIEADKQYTFRDTVKYVNCENCPEGGCDSVINTLRLTFVSDGGQQHTLHVCQGKTYTYTNMSDSYTFNSQGKLCNTPYVYNLEVHVKGVVDGQVVDLCTFNDELTFIVDTVYQNQLTIDTVCIDPEAVAQGLQTYTWENHPKFAAIPITGPGYFTYLDTLKTEKCGAAGGCDSICVLKLRVAPPHQTPTNTEICDNSSFLWEDTLFYGVNYTGTIPAISKQVTEGVYTSRKDSFSRYGCDSILTLRLTVWPTYIAERKDTFVCANEPYNFYGTTYNTPQNPWVAGNSYELKHTVASVHGCDSMVLHNVTVHPIYLNEREENDTVCQVLTGPAYYEWEGADHAYWNSQQLQSLNTAGTFELVDYMETVEHCDSIIHRTLVIMPTYYQPTTWTMSSEGTYIWDNRIYAGMEAEVENPLSLEVVRCTGVMTFTDSLHTDPIGTHSCDSVRTLTLRIGQVFRDTMYDATCVNCGTYEWVITSPITGEDTTIYITELPQAYDTLIYYDSLLTAMQFDSIYVLYLTAYPTHYQTTQDEVCQGEPYIWTDHEPTVGNIPHHLYLNGVEIQEIPTDQYGTIQIVDSMRTLEVYTNPMTGETKQMNCDSVWMLTLTIHPTYNDRYVNLTDLRSMSSNDTISHFTQPHTLFVGYDFDYNAAGTSKAELEAQYERVVYMYSTGEEIWMDSVINNSVQGCDSVHYVRIAICQMKFTAYTDSIADNDSTWFFGGETANRDHTLPLVTGERFHYYDDGTPVKYDSATNRPMREYFFIDTLRTANGCDSIVHLTLHVFPSYRFEFDTAICSNTRYDWRVYDYLNRGRTGYVYDSVNYQIGTHTFDSVYVLGLDVVPSGFWQYDTILCMNDTITWHYQTIFYRPGGLKYIEAEYKEEGSMCGDIYRLNLTFKPYYSTSLVEYDTICQLDDYHWISPDETIEHTAALRDAWGQPITKIPTDVTGDFVYYDSLHTAECGCDSTYTLMLHIKPSYHFYDTLFTLCSSDTLDWHDRRYYYQGEADVFDTVFDISTVYQCDSNYYLRVHFDLSYEITDSLFLCSDLEHFTWQNIVFDDTLAASHYWDAPRDYYFTRKYQTTISHCDSVHHLKLRIAPSYDSIWTDTLCRGETYTLFNQRLTQPGQYTDVQPNRFGCNTYYYLTLVEVPSPVFTLHVEPICVDESGLANNYLLHYSYTGNDAPISYSIRYGEEARSMGFVDEADIPIAPGETTLYLHVPNFSSRDQYPRPNTYDAIISFENGICLSDSLMTYPFTMEMRYPSWITTQHWNDAIFIMDSTLNGGYSFASYQWYRNDTLLHGETRPYLYEPQYLHAGATYSVALTRADDSVTVRTCPIIPDLTKVYGKSPEQTYISVVPTVVAKENPVVYILSPTPGTFKLMNPQGQLVQQGAYMPDEKGTYPVQLPQTSGVYVFHLVESTTAGTGNDLSRTVKVIVQ